MSDSSKYVSVRQAGDVKVLRVDIGELVDYDVADALGQELIRAVGDQGHPKVVVDMGGLGFLSSVGYASFINLRAHVRKLNGHLMLANMSEMIFEVFDATRLLINPSSPKSLFEFRQTVDEAVADLA